MHTCKGLASSPPCTKACHAQAWHLPLAWHRSGHTPHAHVSWCPLQIAGHGNFGSLDDDPPAAMRYTECRLQALSADMLLADLEDGVVGWVPTFDASQV